jgi:two-component system OmpR family response regulator
VIDDDQALLRILTHRLQAGGFQTETALDGFEGERRARSRPPDLVLLDRRMPGRDGLATLAALRAAPETAQIPVILLSGAPGDGDELADLVLCKPCPHTQLLQAVRSLLATRAAGRVP